VIGRVQERADDRHADSRRPVALTRRRFFAVVASIAAAAAVYLAVTLWSGWEDVSVAIAQVGWSGTGIALALALPSFLVRTIRWAVYLKALGYSVPPADNARIYLAGFALTTTPGKLGETLRSVLLRPFRVPYAASLGAFFADRFCDLVGILLITGVLAQILYPAARLVGVVVAVVLAIMVLIYMQEHRVLELVEKFAQRLSRKAAIAVSARALAESALVCLRPARFAFGVAITCIAWGLQALALAYLLSRLGTDLPLALTVFIFFFSTLIGAASLIPSGLGSQEATMIALLTLNGVDRAEAVAATLLLRFATLWFGVAVGLCCTLFVPSRAVPTAPPGGQRKEGK
jgi:glycosyltransferase 2 family protein